MNTLIPITDTISIVPEGFGEYNQQVVHELLRRVVFFFSSIGLMDPVPLVVIHGESPQPMCCKPDNTDIHVIILNNEGKYWCQWIYQFSHEYCHHLINGELTGETKGLMWLEESICHVSSIACLVDMASYCYNSTSPVLNSFSDHFVNYYQRLFNDAGLEQYASYLSDPSDYKTFTEDQILPLSEYIIENRTTLENNYSNDHYSFIAGRLYPLFHNNKNLWKIIQFFSDMRSWTSIESFFDHLNKYGDETNIGSIKKLSSVFIS